MPAWLFASLQGYRIGWVPRDLVAGLMLAAIAIPGQLATARLAGMPPETGLYAFAAGALAFAALGGNRFMSVAADSTIASIFAGGVASMVAVGSQHYTELVTLLALMVELGRHARPHPSRALCRMSRMGRARGISDGRDHRWPEREKR